MSELLTQDTSIRKQVEEMINQKLSEFAYNQVYSSLQGLRDGISRFLDAAKSGAIDATRERWLNVEGQFVLLRKHFQVEGYELVLLPLFAQFSNLHLMNSP